MDRMLVLHRLDLYDDPLIHPEVNAETQIKLFTLVLHVHLVLSKHGKTEFTQLLCQTMLINAFKQPWSQFPMDLDRGTDDQF